MQKTSVDQLRKALAAISPEWSRWFAHCEAIWPQGTVPAGGVTARELCSFLDFSKDRTPISKLEEIRKRFGIRDAEAMTARAGEGWARIGRDTTELPLSEHDLLIKAGDAPIGRQRFVKGHEIAHFFFSGLAARLSEGERDAVVFRRNKQAERFCWDFALELFCPADSRRGWTAAVIKDLLRGVERKQAAKEQSQIGPPLSYWHLRALAGKYGISIRAAIVALDRAPVMDELACGVAVLRYTANLWTGRETGHRVWQSAKPSWGYLIVNQRAAKQGFMHAAKVYDDGDDQVSKISQETLVLKWKTTDKRRWKTARFLTPVSYTPVDVKDEGRYLVVIWHWPKSVG